MAKTKTSFFCKECGAEHSKWMGKCSACGEWNSIIEEVIRVEKAPKWQGDSPKETKKKPQAIHQVSSEHEDRLDLKNTELNRVLGGGLVKGSLVLVGGEPGIGKSTLLLQVALKASHLKILYVSGEESGQPVFLQVKMTGLPLFPEILIIFLLSC